MKPSHLAIGQNSFNRRNLLRLTSAGLLGLGLPQVLALRGNAADTKRPIRPTAKSCIILFQVGGPYQGDTFDPKPDAPSEVRGPFKPISTSIPGIQISESLPGIAAHVDKLAILRGVNHTIRCHNPAIYCSLVGREATDPMAVSNRTTAQRTDHPHYASVAARLRPGLSSMPSHVVIPDHVINGPSKSPGILGGYLGAKYDPLILRADPNAPDFRVEGMGLPADVDNPRLDRRKSLLNRFNEQIPPSNRTEAMDALETYYEKAFSVLTSSKAADAFNLSNEPEKMRNHYGRHTIGQSTLLARRLVEAGVPFVTVLSHVDVDKGSWDTHKNHYDRVGDLLPPADQAFAALLDDMLDRGLLDETLIVWMGEFGRTPRIGITVSNNADNTNGRDHWCNCYSVALAGGGVEGGQVIGASDFMGAYPKERPVHISDLAATIFHALGIDPRTELEDIQGRLRFICDGSPVHEAF